MINVDVLSSWPIFCPIFCSFKFPKWMFLLFLSNSEEFLKWRHILVLAKKCFGRAEGLTHGDGGSILPGEWFHQDTFHQGLPIQQATCHSLWAPGAGHPPAGPDSSVGSKLLMRIVKSFTGRKADLLCLSPTIQTVSHTPAFWLQRVSTQQAYISHGCLEVGWSPPLPGRCRVFKETLIWIHPAMSSVWLWQSQYPSQFLPSWRNINPA